MSEVNYLRRAVEFGMAHSDDPRTKVGAMIVAINKRGGSILGANRLPKGVEANAARVSREHKDRYIEHAERDVIYGAVRCGVDTNGSVMYAPWFCCCHCARAIIESGIREVVGLMSLHSMTPARWSADIAAAHQMLEEAGVGMRWITAELGTTILFDGKEIEI
jgi:deoxycytidylate deaminase